MFLKDIGIIQNNISIFMVQLQKEVHNNENQSQPALSMWGTGIKINKCWCLAAPRLQEYKDRAFRVWQSPHSGSRVETTSWKKKKTIPVWEQRLEWKAVSLEPQENKWKFLALDIQYPQVNVRHSFELDKNPKESNCQIAKYKDGVWREKGTSWVRWELKVRI